MTAIRDVTTKRTGPGATSLVKLQGVADAHPTLNEMAEAQAEAGYHPAGYGGPFDAGFHTKGDGTVLVTWYCYGSAD